MASVMLLIYIALFAILAFVIVRAARRSARRQENSPVSPPPGAGQPPYSAPPGVNYGSPPTGPGGQTAIASPVTGTPAYCGACGHALGQPALFCTKCGTQVRR
jgi:hypothetical protein